jgi:glycosyltransferase involved in cell wall biosynthesis
MRALIAAPYYPPHPGGIERFSASVAAELVRRGWQVDVVHCATDQEALERVEGPAGERLHGLEARMVAGRLPFPRRTERNTAVMAEIRRTSFDFVLINSHLFVSSLMVARAVGDRNALWLNHGCDHVAAGNVLADAAVTAYEHVLASRLRRTVTRAAGVSEEAAAWLSHLRVSTRSSVGNAVAQVSPPRSGRREGPLRVVSVGRLEPGKGALEAIALIDSLPPSVHVDLTVCGGGSLAPQVERAALASPRLTATGPLPHAEVQELLADADVVVCLSESEGFPTVLLEAGAAGCAVLTYPVGGTKELLADGGGWRVDDLQEAAARLTELAERPSDATAAGEVLRSTVEATYTWPPVVDRLLRLVGRTG